MRAMCAVLALMGSMFGCLPVAAQPLPAGDAEVSAWSEQFASEVDHRLDVPVADRPRYLELLEQALVQASFTGLPAQAFVVVDRNPAVQAAFIVLGTSAAGWHWLGASAVSTGKPGTFEHFVTPLGVFPHSLGNPDYRAEGTFNENHIRGYGLKGRRVFDFGWQLAERGWGVGGRSVMRFQMHATDPSVLERRLGRVASEGCIRIAATLNVFLDRHGVLDADYEEAAANGEPPWVLRPDRQTIPWPGRFLVIVDSQATKRPAWSPLPGAKPVVKPASKPLR
jgi:hypothetical protein